MRAIVFLLLILALAACGVSTAADPVAAGGRIFTIQCGGCHAVSEVGSDALGPSLDAMRARAQAQPDPAAWLDGAIIDPNAEIAPGYQAGLMPSGYGSSLRPDELDALVTYMLAQGGDE